MASGVYMDTKEFDKAIVQYAAAFKKDSKDVVHKQLLNLSIKAVKIAKNADRNKIKADIESLKKQGKWQGMVARAIKKSQGRYTKAQARAFSKKMERQRMKAVGFVRFFFIKMSQTVAPLVEGRGRKGKSFAGMNAKVKPATKRKPTASVNVWYSYKRRGEKTARGADKKLDGIMRLALIETVLDMQKYIDRKMGKTARRYSARAA